MSDHYQRIEIITGTARRRRWTADEKLRMVEETLMSGDSISAVARRNGVAPNLLYRWRRLMTQGGAVAVQADGGVTSNGAVRRLEDRVRELERQLGRKTLEVEILKEALAKAQTKTRPGCRRRCSRTVRSEDGGDGDRGVALEPGRTAGGTHKAASALSKSARRGAVAAHPPSAGRTADVRLPADHGAGEPGTGSPGPAAGQPQAGLSDHEGARALVGETHRPPAGHCHDGRVVVMRSNIRWCSDGFEFGCWEVVRTAFVIDAHDREVIAWRAVANAGISGSEIRDMMIEAVETRFGAIRAPNPVEWLSDNGSPYTARETRVFATQLNLVPCFTPVASPESNGLCEAFVRTFKRDYLRINPLPDALTALRQLTGWFEDYNEHHPHSGLKMRSPRESSEPTNPPRCPLKRGQQQEEEDGHGRLQAR